MVHLECPAGESAHNLDTPFQALKGLIYVGDRYYEDGKKGIECYTMQIDQDFETSKHLPYFDIQTQQVVLSCPHGEASHHRRINWSAKSSEIDLIEIRSIRRTHPCQSCTIL